MKLFVLFVFLVSIYESSARVHLPQFNITYVSGQITPTGINWPKFTPVSGPIFYSTYFNATLCQLYANKVIVTRVSLYMDLEIMEYKNCKVLAMILAGGDTTFPGSSIRRFKNEQPFTTREEVFPVTEILITKLAEIGGLFKNITVESQFRDWVIAELDASDGNAWKDFATSAGFLLTPILAGSIALTAAIFSAINLCKLIFGGVKNPTVLIVVNSFNFVGSTLRVIGFIDFMGYRQILESRAAMVVSVVGIAPTFSACLYMTMVFLSTIDRSNLKVRIMMPRYYYPYIILNVIIFANDYINSSLNATLLQADRSGSLTIGIVWTAVTGGIVMAFGIMFTVASIKVMLAIRKHNGISSNGAGIKQSRKIDFTKTFTLCFIIGINLFFYSIVSIVAFLGPAGNPEKSLLFNFAQPLALSIISISLALITHFKITKTPSSSSSGAKQEMSSNKTTTSLGETQSAV